MEEDLGVQDGSYFFFDFLLVWSESKKNFKVSRLSRCTTTGIFLIIY